MGIDEVGGAGLIGDEAEGRVADGLIPAGEGGVGAIGGGGCYGRAGGEGAAAANATGSTGVSADHHGEGELSRDDVRRIAGSRSEGVRWLTGPGLLERVVFVAEASGSGSYCGMIPSGRRQPVVVHVVNDDAHLAGGGGESVGVRSPAAGRSAGEHEAGQVDRVHRVNDVDPVEGAGARNWGSGTVNEDGEAGCLAVLRTLRPAVRAGGGQDPCA